MAFFGYEFIFDGQSSSQFGLFISGLDSSGLINSSMGSGVNPIVKKILRNPVEYIYGIEISPVLEFDLTFNSGTYLSAIDRNIIGQWLFGQTQYKRLQIVQPDLQNVYFNCIITNSTAVYVGNVQIGWNCHIKCDSPFAYEFPIVQTVDGNEGGIVIWQNNVNNISATNDYTYPLLSFTMNNIGTSFSIQNTTDNNRIFLFDGIDTGETIVVDNQHQIITSSTGYMRISKFNKKFFRLLPGINALSIVGGFLSFTITYTPFRKIGG